MSLLTIPHTFADGPVLTAAQLNDNFAAVATVVNGGLDTDNSAAAAGYTNAQLATPYEHAFVPLRYVANAFPVAGTILAEMPVPAITGTTGGDWLAESLWWSCLDSGDGAGKFNLLYGHYSDAGAWVTDTTLASGVTMLLMPTAAADTPSCGSSALGLASLTRDATYPRMLRVTVHTQGVGVLSAGADQFQVLVKLARPISGV